MTAPQNPIYCALDVPGRAAAHELAMRLGPSVGGLKLGLEFFCGEGPQGVKALTDLGLPVFLDLKLHDIPNTVASAIRSLAPLNVSIVNVHAAGGPAMMRAAAQAAFDAGEKRPRVLAVTVLTSLDASDLNAIGVAHAPRDQVVRLANLAQESGLDGVVCSAQEIEAVRKACGPDFLIVVPGIRPAGSATGDQKRMATPKEALAAGADILVIGRPITGAPDPAEAARAIAASLR